MNTEARDGWIPVEEYMQRYGESKSVIQKRVSEGHWRRGYHYSAPEPHNAMVHEERAREWRLMRKVKPE